MGESELLGIVLPLLDGLAEVHGAVCSGNIMLRAVDGSPVLLDFGLAVLGLCMVLLGLELGIG